MNDVLMMNWIYINIVDEVKALIMKDDVWLFWMIILFWESSIYVERSLLYPLGRFCCCWKMLYLWGWVPCLVEYLPEYHPYILTLNDMSKCWELLPRRISNPFSAYGIKFCWWWNFDPRDSPWARWWVRMCYTLNLKGTKFSCYLWVGM